MSEFLPAIVVIAYNRDDSLSRLLSYIDRADYSCADSKSIELIISIDKSDNPKVLEVAKSYSFPFGRKHIVEHKERMGLKKHVFECSKYASEYGSAIVLEDDLCVAEDFYNYAKLALEYSEADDRIAGISLYNHLLNVHARKPFEAIKDGYDNYYFQFASSWGQVYSKRQWEDFWTWYTNNESISLYSEDIPQNVSKWGDNSWLKYFIAYVIKENKFFLYPQISLSSNFSQDGTHKMGQSTDLQVPMLVGENKEWRFSSLDESYAVYDAFFENMKIKPIGYEDAVLDLYGYKGNIKKTKYLLSSKALPYKVEKSFGRRLRPVEMNILNEQQGKDFYLYNTEIAEKKPKINHVAELLYNYRAFKALYGIEIISKRIRDKIKCAGYSE